MDLQKIIGQAELEIKDKKDEADRYLHNAKASLAEAKTKRASVKRQEIELAKFQTEIDKKIAKLEKLEAIKLSEQERGILKADAEESMERANKMTQDAMDKKIESENLMKQASDRELKAKSNAKNYKEKLKKAAISNLLDLMFKEV